MHKLFQSAAAVLISFVLFSTVPTAFAETVRTNDSTYRVIGYLPDWSYQYYTKVDYSALTHLDIAFCNPDENSNISCNIPDDTLQTIINTAHQYNVKVMPSVATTVSTVTFASLIDTPEKITKLNDNLIAYCQKFGFDGIDLDIERGSTDAVWNYYGNWVSALRVECDANGLELSTATAEWTAKKISPETFACFDFVMVMAYADDSSTVSHALCLSASFNFLHYQKYRMLLCDKVTEKCLPFCYNEITKQQKGSEKPVLLDFYADWCGPCQMVSPVVDEIAKEYPEYLVGKINVDEQMELAAKFGVSSIPLLVVMKDGKIVNHALGARPKDAILSMLQG